MAGANLLEQVRASGVLPPEKLVELARLPEATNPDPRVLGRLLWERGYLSRYQVNLIAAGRGKELRVGPYLLLDRIGEGGMGMIFKARHLQHNLLVALKLVRKEKLGSPDSVKRFGREMHAIATLNHPNIVRALDYGQFDGTPYIAMEYVDGTDLSRLVKQNGPLPVAVACEYLRQGAIGLAEAHAQGIIHRDIKPSNLLVSAADGAAPVVKLLDLGLARLGDPAEGALHLTRVGQVLGTPDYLSPEQARDARHVDARADVYSLGCTLFYVLTGRPPFQANTLPDLLIKHQSEPPPPLRRLCRTAPPALETLLNRLLAKKPEQRAQTAAEVAAALEPFTRDPQARPVVIKPPPPPPLADDLWEPQKNGRARPTSGGRRRLLLAAAIGGGLTALVVGLAALLWSRGTGTPENTNGKKPPARKKVTEEKPPPVKKDEKKEKDKTKGKPPPNDRPQLRASVKEEGGHLILTGHPDKTRVRAVAVSPNEKLVASGDEKGNVLIWDVAERKLLHRLPAKGRVRSLAFDGDRRLVAGATGGVFTWDLTDGAPVERPWREGTFLAPDLSALSHDPPAGKLRLWLADGKPRGKALDFEASDVSVGYSPDSQRALVIGAAALLVFDVATGTIHLKGRLVAREHPTAGCWGRHEREIILGCHDRWVRVTALNAPADGEKVGQEQAEAINCVALSPSKRHVLAGGQGPLHYINLDTPKRTEYIFTGHVNKVQAVAFFPSGTRAVSADNGGVVRVWDLGKRSSSPPPPPPPPVRVDRKPTRFVDSEGVTCLALSGDGKDLLSGSADGKVRLWDVAAGTSKQDYFTDHLKPISSVRFTSRGRLLVFGAGRYGQSWLRDNAKAAWDYDTQTSRSDTINGVDFVVYTRGRLQSEWIAAATEKALVLWSGSAPRAPGTREPSFPLVAGRFTCVTRLGELGHFACGDAAGRIHVFRIHVRQQGNVIEATLLPPRSYAAHSGPVHCLAYNPVRRHLLSGGQDGKVFTRQMDDYLSTDRVPAERMARPTPVAEPGSPVLTLAFTNSDGTRYVCGCRDGRVQLHRYDRPKPIASSAGSKNAVRSLVVADGGRRVIYAADAIREWDLPPE